MVNTCSGILFTHEKEGNPAICDNIGLRSIILSEVSQTERQILYGITHVECKKKKSKSYKHRVNRWLPGAWGGGNRERLVKGTKRKNVHFKITSKIRRFSYTYHLHIFPHEII